MSLRLVVALGTDAITVHGAPVDFCGIRAVAGQREIDCGFAVAIGSAYRTPYGDGSALKLRIGE